TDGIVHRELSEAERTEPHLRAVFDLIVAQHPSFTELKIQDEWWGWVRTGPPPTAAQRPSFTDRKIQDEWWGWARKAPGEPRRMTLETSRPLGALVAGGRPRAPRAGAGAAAGRELLALEQVRVPLGPGAGLEVRPQPLEAGRGLLGRARGQHRDPGA